MTGAGVVWGVALFLALCLIAGTAFVLVLFFAPQWLVAKIRMYQFKRFHMGLELTPGYIGITIKRRGFSLGLAVCTFWIGLR